MKRVGNKSTDPSERQTRFGSSCHQSRNRNCKQVSYIEDQTKATTGSNCTARPIAVFAALHFPLTFGFNFATLQSPDQQEQKFQKGPGGEETLRDVAFGSALGT
jgi:hypothetical protein